MMREHSTILYMACMSALAAPTMAQQGRLSPELQFARVDSVTKNESGPEVLVGGRALPRGFSIRNDRVEGHREYKRPMEFQLVVPPAKVKVGSAELDVIRPFYCSKEVITFEQASSFLRRFGSDTEAVLRFATYTKENFVSGDANQEIQRAADELVNAPTAPAIGLSLSDCMELCQELGSMIGMVVRLPTLGEWCAAMRCGEPSRYWWGDDWLSGPAAALVSGPQMPTADRLTAIADRRRLARNREDFGYLFGTICEVVWPNDRERDVLRDIFGKELASDNVTYHPDSAVGCYGGFLIGSSVFPIQSQLPESLYDPSFVRLSQFTGMPRELAGIRIVIEIPVGPVEVRERPDSDVRK